VPVLWSVQVMRGAAALLVVIGHTQSAVEGVVVDAGGRFARSTLLPWGAGVDLFFVISGFIMVYTAGRLFGTPCARTTFIRRRLVRIVPLYWVVSAAFLLLLAAAAAKGGDPLPSVGAIAASFAFLPADTRGDGLLFPVFDLGWTLNYEMFFYALFAVAVGLPRRQAMVGTGIALVLLVAVGGLLSPGTAAWFWTRPIILDFGLGLAVGAASGTVLPVLVRFLLLIAATGLLLVDPAGVFAGPAGTTVTNDWPRVIFAGVPVAAILAAAVLGPAPALPQIARPLVRLGDASYSLYLLHPVALIVLEKAAQKTMLARIVPGAWLVFATVLAALALALVGHRWLERPLTLAVASRLSPRRR